MAPRCPSAAPQLRSIYQPNWPIRPLSDAAGFLSIGPIPISGRLSALLYGHLPAGLCARPAGITAAPIRLPSPPRYPQLLGPAAHRAGNPLARRPIAPSRFLEAFRSKGPRGRALPSPAPTCAAGLLDPSARCQARAPLGGRGQRRHPCGEREGTVRQGRGHARAKGEGRGRHTPLPPAAARARVGAAAAARPTAPERRAEGKATPLLCWPPPAGRAEPDSWRQQWRGPAAAAPAGARRRRGAAAAAAEAPGGAGGRAGAAPR